MFVPITALYAALLAITFFVLSLRTIKARGRAHVALGLGDDDQLLRKARVHGNFAEYIPFALLLMALLELNDAYAWFLHGLGIALVLGRACHIYGVDQKKQKFAWRFRGMQLTLTTILTAAITLLVMLIIHLANLA